MSISSLNRYLPFAADEPWKPATPPDLSAFDEIELDGEFTGVDWHRGDRPVGWAVGTAAGTCYLPFAHRGGQNLDEGVVKRWAERELRGKRIRNHSTKSDVHMMRAWGVDLRAQGCTFHDVQHSAALLDDHRRTFTLNELAQVELGESKLDVGPPQMIAELPGGAVAPYAEQDVALVRKLAAVYAPRLRAEGLERVSRLEDRVIEPTLEMESNGMPIDLELLHTWQHAAAALSDELAYRIYRLVGFSVNPDSPTDMAKLFRHYGALYGSTATGRPSFTADIVKAAAETHEGIRLVYRLGKLQDLRSKYLDKYAREHVDGVLYPTLHQLKVDDAGTVSGRFSCVRPNLQQVLNKDKHERAYKWLLEYGDHSYLIKRLFRAIAGRWCSADMKQVEYRIFAHYTRSARLLRQYAENPLIDFHNIVQEYIRPFRSDMTRTEVKTFNFLSIFGGGVGAAARNLNIDIGAADELMRVYHQQFPEARDLLDLTMRVASKRGYVRTIYGRRCRFPDRQRLHKSLNAVVQGSAADVNKQKIVDMYDRRKELEILMRMTVHDELAVELLNPAKQGAYMTALAEQAIPFDVPILWDVKTGPSWGECA